jgi:hypothetical protein
MGLSLWTLAPCLPHGPCSDSWRSIKSWYFSFLRQGLTMYSRLALKTCDLLASASYVLGLQVQATMSTSFSLTRALSLLSHFSGVSLSSTWKHDTSCCSSTLVWMTLGLLWKSLLLPGWGWSGIPWSVGTTAADNRAPSLSRREHYQSLWSLKEDINGGEAGCRVIKRKMEKL